MMAEGPTSQKEVSPEELRELLESNRYKIVEKLDVVRLLPEFRSKHMMDRTDEERIKSNTTSIEKASCLLDVVLQCGDKACQLLMDEIEKRHPALYKDLTGKESNRLRRMKTVVDRSPGGLSATLTSQVLQELNQAIQENDYREKELIHKHGQLDATRRELEDERRRGRRLHKEKKKLEKRNANLQAKAAETNELRKDLERLNVMMTETLDRMMVYQKEADMAKHHARLVTFKNFHQEMELKECKDKFQLERRQTQHLQKVSKKHEQWVTKHNQDHSQDRRKVEALQAELEKIDNFRKSTMFVDSQCDVNITEKVKAQLDEAQRSNESLSLQLKQTQEKNDKYKNDLAVARKQQKMMKETMRMNRAHLEMSQEELATVSKDRVEINQNYSELFEKLSQSIVQINTLQNKLNKVRIDYANLSEQVRNNGIESVDMPVATHLLNKHSIEEEEEEEDIALEGDNDDDEEDDTDVDSDDDDDHKDGNTDDSVWQQGNSNTEADMEHEIKPVQRDRSHRLSCDSKKSTSHSHRTHLEKMHSLEMDFAQDSTMRQEMLLAMSSSTPTTGDEEEGDAAPSLGYHKGIASTDGFPTYDFSGSLSGEDADDDVRRSKFLDLDFIHQQTVTRRSRSRDHRFNEFRGRRRSRSLSRMEDYGSLDVMPGGAGCLGYDDTPPFLGPGGVVGVGMIGHTPNPTSSHKRKYGRQGFSGLVKSWLASSDKSNKYAAQAGPAVIIHSAQGKGRKKVTENAVSYIGNPVMTHGAPCGDKKMSRGLRALSPSKEHARLSPLKQKKDKKYGGKK